MAQKAAGNMTACCDPTRAQDSDDEDLVMLCTSQNLVEIALIRLRLDQAHIPYVTSNESVAFWYRVGVLAEVRFLVQRKDQQRALEALRAHGLR